MQKQFGVSDFVAVVAAGLAGSVVAVALLLFVTEDIDANLAFAVVVPAQLGSSLLALAWVRKRRQFTGFEDAYGLTVETSDLLYLAVGVGLNILLTLAVVPLVQALQPEENPLGTVEAVQGLEGFAVVAGALVLGIGVPLVEELTYRGLLLRLLLQRRSERTAVIASSAIFALAHVQALRAFDGETLLIFFVVVVPVFFVLGVVMARLTIRHGRLGPAIFVHAGYDLLSFALLVLAPRLVEDFA